jgi:hypothetical protein
VLVSAKVCWLRYLLFEVVPGTRTELGGLTDWVVEIRALGADESEPIGVQTALKAAVLA